jgi:hypothetical protein
LRCFGWGIFDRRNNFLALETKKVLAGTPVDAVQQFMSWVLVYRWPVFN